MMSSIGWVRPLGRMTASYDLWLVSSDWMPNITAGGLDFVSTGDVRGGDFEKLNS